jgi:hypothetical protein
MSGEASRLGDRAKATGADVYPLRQTINLNSCSLNVRPEHPVCLVIGVADVVAKSWPLATDVTLTGHTGPLYVVVLIHLRLRTRSARQGIPRARKEEE